MTLILKKILFEYILCYFVQSFIYILGVFAICRCRLSRDKYFKYITSSLILFGFRVILGFIPINYGVSSLLILGFTIFLAIWYMKFPLNYSIEAGLFISVILIISELSSMALLTIIVGAEKVSTIMCDNLTKFEAAIPATIISGALSLISYQILKNRPLKVRKQNDDESNGDI